MKHARADGILVALSVLGRHLPPEPDMGAESVELVVLDVDGVLTDGTISLDDQGVERKFYHVRDGTAIKYLIRAGLRVAIISGRSCRANVLRAEELGIEDVYQNAKVKLTAYEDLLAKHGLPDERVCCVGDDLPYLPLLRRAGFAVAVADAADELRQAAHYVTRTPGGKGAVREVTELILRAQHKWSAILERYLEDPAQPK